MREIKFRFWDKKHRAWEKEYSCYGIGLDRTIVRHFDNDNTIAQQYTGLKDKNGVEIYEGDTIIFDNSDIGGQRYKGIVEWNTDPTLDGLCFGLFIPSKFGNLPDPSCKQSQMWVKSGWLSTDFLGDLEVIGNIFEGVDK